MLPTLASEARIPISLTFLQVVVSHLAVHQILELHYLMFLFGNLIMLNDQEPNLSSFDHCRSILLIVLFLQMVQLDFDFVSLRNGSNQASRKGGIDRREMFRIF